MPECLTVFVLILLILSHSSTNTTFCRGDHFLLSPRKSSQCTHAMFPSFCCAGFRADGHTRGRKHIWFSCSQEHRPQASNPAMFKINPPHFYHVGAEIAVLKPWTSDNNNIQHLIEDRDARSVKENENFMN